MKQMLVMIIALSFFVSAQTPAPAKSIHFKELQKCLPVKGPDGFTREKPKGQTVSNAGFSTSNASVEFTAPKKEKQLQSSDDGKQDSVETDVTWNASIEIVDYAGMGEGMSASLQAISGMQFENETDEGFERSTTFAGYKGIEKSHSQDNSKSCSMQLVVADRFIVTANGNGFADMTILQSLLNATDLKKLSSLK